MNEFIVLITTFPVIVPTFLLAVVSLYWLLVLIGTLDMEFFDIDVDIDSDTDASIDDSGGLGAFLANWGLTGVPFSLVISLMVVLIWLICAVVMSLLSPLLPLSVLRWVVGAGVLLAAFMVTIPITARLIRPLRTFFRAHVAINKDSLTGRECVVKTLTVRENFGQAELTDGEAGLLLDIIADEPNDISKGDTVILLEYDAERDSYWVKKY
ncbi:MAG: hypothetical protein CSA47_02445 [Gammaproteobacteria bacterium]|nr:MAG: hypothetical protein CSA47_02445 [Gammaproteobacteria bacterium]